MSRWAGNLIQLARIEADLTQQELADLAGTSQPAIAAYESGKRSPSIETLARIVRAAGQDFRIGLVPYDDHDDWVKDYERRLSKKAAAAVRRLDEKLVAMARLRS